MGTAIYKGLLIAILVAGMSYFLGQTIGDVKYLLENTKEFFAGISTMPKVSESLVRSFLLFSIALSLAVGIGAND